MSMTGPELRDALTTLGLSMRVVALRCNTYENAIWRIVRNPAPIDPRLEKWARKAVRGMHDNPAPDLSRNPRRAAPRKPS